jgi:phage tail-like protein
MARSSTVDAVEKFRFSVSVLNIGFDPVSLVQNFTGFLRAGFSEADLPKQTTNVVRYRENIDPLHSQKMPGLTDFEAVSFKRGMTSNSDFFRWASDVHNASGTIATGIQSGNSDFNQTMPAEATQFRRDVLIVVYGRGGGSNAGLPGGIGNSVADVAGAAGLNALGIGDIDTGLSILKIGDVKKAFLLHNAWVTKYAPGDTLSASDDGTKLIEEMTLEYESFEEITPEALVSNTIDAIAGEFF